jgi:NAD(P)H-hydrate repair Nnr-like enzyme with NAD(P)H-hydrate dehydratase domain
MGDVLTGIVAATWAQTKDAGLSSGLRSAALAAWIHGKAADLAVRDYPERTLLASDLAAKLPETFKTLWHRKVRGGHL